MVEGKREIWMSRGGIYFISTGVLASSRFRRRRFGRCKRGRRAAPPMTIGSDYLIERTTQPHVWSGLEDIEARGGVLRDGEGRSRHEDVVQYDPGVAGEGSPHASADVDTCDAAFPGLDDPFLVLTTTNWM